MAAETNTDRINRLEGTTATLNVRVDNLRDSVKRAETTATTLDIRLHDVDKHLAPPTQKVDRLESQSNKLD